MLKEQKDEIKLQREKMTEQEKRPFYVMSSRHIERFRGKPEKTGDVGIDKWVDDIKGTGEV